MLYFGAALVAAFDQLMKYLVKTRMEIGESIPIFGDFLRLTSHRNAGAAWGILQGQRWFLIVMAIAVIVGIIYYSRRIESKLSKIALPILMGGALGNLIDRLLYGQVLDFLDVRIINYPIFNTADVAIVTAVALLLLDSFRLERNAEPHPK
ncbi:signal peptidase II [Effusibacillus consociatus]|uniref:Lipoprotein signal peptidase n=1 Tax=Effusibacillus consociatus TaxID=1117041 RepID=A0ABV9Q5W8_9BACL